jgi:hypothetical protein
MSLFTFISDCEGGSYASQHKCDSIKFALMDWLQNMPPDLHGAVFGDDLPCNFDQIIHNMETGMLDLVKIKGLEAVWGGYVSINKKDIFIFVVETKIGSR